MEILVKALRGELDQELNLGLELLAGDAGLSRRITNPRVQKPGLALTGFVDAVRPHTVQVLGNTEMKYLDSLDADRRASAVLGLLECTNLPCIILTNSHHPGEPFLESAQNRSIPIFRSGLATEEFINRLNALLDEFLSPEVVVHGVVCDVFGVGVLISGASGIGKSETALDLVMRGHRLVADDVVRIRTVNRMLMASGSELTRHHMEVRGLGIINVMDLFGAAAVRERKRIELIVEMVEFEPGVEYDRIGIDDPTDEILGLQVAKVRLPIRPGRPVASIVEVAARNHLLKLQGHHAARKFQAALEKRLASNEGVTR